MNSVFSKNWRLLLAVILTAIVAYIAIKVEVLNYRSDNYLPRQNVTRDDGSTVPWRTSSDELREYGFRRRVLVERRNFEYVDEESFERAINELELTDSEQEELDAYVSKWRANRQLRDTMNSIGCFQHLLVPVALIFLIPLFSRGRPGINALVGLCIAINIAAGVLMFYRQYFLSTMD